MSKADALEAADALKALERTRVLRADAVDQDLVELAHLVRADHWEGQHVPEREAEIVDQHLTARLGMPILGIKCREQHVKVAGRGLQINLGRELRDQAIEPVEMAVGERLGIAAQVPHLVR